MKTMLKGDIHMKNMEIVKKWKHPDAEESMEQKLSVVIQKYVIQENNVKRQCEMYNIQIKHIKLEEILLCTLWYLHFVERN